MTTIRKHKYTDGHIYVFNMMCTQRDGWKTPHPKWSVLDHTGKNDGWWWVMGGGFGFQKNSDEVCGVVCCQTTYLT